MNKIEDQIRALNALNPAWWSQRCSRALASAKAAQRQHELFLEWYAQNFGKDDNYQTAMNVSAFLEQAIDTLEVRI